MAIINNIIDSPVHVFANVARILQTSEKRASYLCRHPHINKWAKYKPVNDDRIIIDRKAHEPVFLSSGINLNNAAETDAMAIINPFVRYEYDSVDADKPARILDFLGYKHNAEPPCVILHHITKVEMNSTGERFILGATEQLSQYNLMFDDVLGDLPNFNPAEWRLAVMMTDEEYSQGLRFWTSEYAWDSNNTDKYEVIVNANTMSLRNGETVGIVAFLLKTGEGWSMNDFSGFDIDQLPRALYPNDYKAIALPTIDYADHSIAEVKRNDTYANITVNHIEFKAIANKVNDDVPNQSGNGEKYSQYEITNAEIMIVLNNVLQHYEYFRDLSFRFELYLEQYYDVSNDPNLSFMSYKSSGVADISKEHIPEVMNDDDEQTITVMVSTDNTDTKKYIYTTYSNTEELKCQLRIYVSRVNFPGSEVLLRVIDIPFKPDGTPINVFNEE